MENEKYHFVYILECSDRTLYTGYTTDLERRIKVHNASKGAKYTRGRLPVKLMYYENHDSAGVALKREYEIKKKTRQQKLELINSKNNKENGGVSVEEVSSYRQ
ncbi:MAG: GIY-YIG nuclease family protein [Proteocatella sp.]